MKSVKIIIFSVNILTHKFLNAKHPLFFLINLYNQNGMDIAI